MLKATSRRGGGGCTGTCALQEAARERCECGYRREPSGRASRVCLILDTECACEVRLAHCIPRMLYANCTRFLACSLGNSPQMKGSRVLTMLRDRPEVSDVICAMFGHLMTGKSVPDVVSQICCMFEPYSCSWEWRPIAQLECARKTEF